MVAPLSAADIRRKYDRLAPWYDLLEGPMDFMFFKRRRRKLLARAGGLILEVAAGTGKNFRHYPSGARLVASDLSWEMLVRAKRRARSLGIGMLFVQADAENLPFRAESFEKVVTTFSLCTVPDPERALREMGRACEPGGEILLLEHVLSDKPWVARLEQRLTPWTVRRTGCHLDRKTGETIRSLGLPIRERAAALGGILQSFVVGPRRVGGGAS